MVDHLVVVLGYNKKKDSELCKLYKVKDMPWSERLSWISRSLKDYPNIEVKAYEDFEDEYIWDHHIAWHRNNIAPHIDKVFSSEPSYSEHFTRMYPEAEHVILDADRKIVPISATEIRKDPFKYWDYLPESTRSFFTKRILITGIESVGKSTMVHKLAEHFQTNEVQEVGRTWCEEFGNCLSEEMFDTIGMEHNVAIEKAVYGCNKYLFVDTDAIITQYYLRKYVDEYSTFLDDIVVKQMKKWDLIIALRATVPWVADGYRFLPNNRLKEETALKQMYDSWRMKFEIVDSEDYEQRFLECIKLIDHFQFD
jgi:HTH-type transcriptional repressor of NAD biosynthesis genes